MKHWIFLWPNVWVFNSSAGTKMLCIRLRDKRRLCLVSHTNYIFNLFCWQKATSPLIQLNVVVCYLAWKIWFQFFLCCYLLISCCNLLVSYWPGGSKCDRDRRKFMKNWKVSTNCRKCEQFIKVKEQCILGKNARNSRRKYWETWRIQKIWYKTAKQNKIANFYTRFLLFIVPKK